MGKYFGTDGVRGEANVELTPELAMFLVSMKQDVQKYL